MPRRRSSGRPRRGSHGARPGGWQCGPGTINPPGSVRLRRQGASAEYVCPRRDDKPLDTVHDLLGVEYFTLDPELEAARPAAIADGAVVKIGQLVRRLERGVDAIRNWIELGVIPPAPIRLAGNVPAWPAAEAEAEAIVAAARRERILSKPRRPISEPTSPCALGKPAPPSRCGAIEKRKLSRLPR